MFAAQCAACHQATGKGLPGVFPPLDGSEWVQGEPRIVANILLHGITGEIRWRARSFRPDALVPSAERRRAGRRGQLRPRGLEQQVRAHRASVFEAERKAGAARTTPFEGGAALKALMK
jgi:hypothetical protein